MNNHPIPESRMSNQLIDNVLACVGGSIGGFLAYIKGHTILSIFSIPLLSIDSPYFSAVVGVTSTVIGGLLMLFVKDLYIKFVREKYFKTKTKEDEHS